MTCLITALDFPTEAQADQLAEQLDPSMTRLKVGNELFTLGGPSLVKRLQARGFDVFLDLKFHDIPNTVQAAVARAADLGVWMVNVHAGGGRRMLDAARAAVPAYAGETGGTRLIAVTVLTSLERVDLVDVGIDVEPDRQVKRLAALTRETGLDGVVCSPQEIGVIRDLALLKKPAHAQGSAPASFMTVTPGIRPIDTVAGSDDQRRTLSPREAILAGADHLVIGRPITRASDPLAALTAIAAETDSACDDRARIDDMDESLV